MQDFYLTRVHTLEYMARLSRIDSGDATTLYLPHGMTTDEVESRIRACGRPIPAGLVEVAQSSLTGFCLFSGPGPVLVFPPFPIQESVAFEGHATAPLEEMLREEKMIAIVLVRLGAYGLGVCRGERLVTSKVGTGLVHARHRQGGSSAQRFRRHREKQIEQFLIRVCQQVNDRIGVYLEQLEFVTYGGAWTTVELLKKRCPILVRLDGRELPPLLDITDPRQAVLEASLRRVWSSRILDWSQDVLSPTSEVTSC